MNDFYNYKARKMREHKINIEKLTEIRDKFLRSSSNSRANIMDDKIREAQLPIVRNTVTILKDEKLM
jgi:hypothetical protein